MCMEPREGVAACWTSRKRAAPSFIDLHRIEWSSSRLAQLGSTPSDPCAAVLRSRRLHILGAASVELLGSGRNGVRRLTASKEGFRWLSAMVPLD